MGALPDKTASDEVEARESGIRWRRLGVVAASLLALVLCVEALLRFGFGFGDAPLARLDPATEYELVGPGSYARWGNRIDVNTAGLRAPELAAQPSPNERRVLLVGDSVVYGGHRLDQDETIAARLVDVLERDPRLAGCVPVAMPMAASSWGPVNQAAFLARDGHLGADVAAIVVSAHDLYDVPNPAGSDVPYQLQPSRTAIGDVMGLVLDRLAGDGAPAHALSEAERSQASLAALEQMVEQLDLAGVPVILVYHPTVPELTDNDRDEQAVFAEWADDRGVAFVDLGGGSAAPDGYRDVIHPNAVGAERLAADLQAALVPLLVPCGDS